MDINNFSLLNNGQKIDFSVNDIFIILDNIKKTKGWFLYQKAGSSRLMYSQFLINLESDGLIDISGKQHTEGLPVKYFNIELTERGMAYYNMIKRL